MRHKRAEYADKHVQFIRGQRTVIVNIVKKRHHGGNCGIKLHILDIKRNLLDRLMERTLELGCHSAARYDLRQSRNTLKKALASAYCGRRPRCGLFKISDEHFIKSECIGAVLLDDIVGIYDISARFRHLLSVLTEDHAVSSSLEVRLGAFQYTDIVEKFRPEARIKKMKRNVLHPAVIPIYGHPIIKSFLGCKLSHVVRIAIAEEIPR